jgi:hypothetical protein
VRTRHEAIALERDRAPLGAPQDRSGELEGRARRRLAGHDELFRHLDVAFQLGEITLNVPDHRLGHARPAVLESVPRVRRRGELRADDEQLALEAQDQLREAAQARGQRADPAFDAEVRPGQPERGDGLVDRAVGLGARVVLGDPRPAVQQARGAVVAARTNAAAAGPEDKAEPRPGASALRRA